MQLFVGDFFLSSHSDNSFQTNLLNCYEDSKLQQWSFDNESIHC